MHILINMNYIGFYLCYLLQTAKLINVLSSVLTQLFRKVKEVQRSFPRAAPGTLSVGRLSGSPDGDTTHGVAGNELTRLGLGAAAAHFSSAEKCSA